ncbi:Carboxylic ester hydrolase [Aphelenchoides bicaudatus]|nr:Carboxylic ester hydrolase [Aphelenchoides bicaudatus]
MSSKLLLFLLLLGASCVSADDELKEEVNDGPRVQTLNGPIQGFQIELPANNRQKTGITAANIYLGVPFAQPPVGDLRFEKPQPVKNWNETLDASEFPYACPPCHPLAALSYDEDCLRLNIFTPNNTASSESNGYPVLLYVHGGGFCTGSSSQFGFDVISDNFVSQGIITVSIQYRLGFLGFFSNGDSELPGNLGLWDQRQAFIWIKDNIALFGGDPNRITVYGQSAGAVSTSMHSLSKHSRGLFQQMILHSGSPYSEWASNDDVIEMSRKLAETVSCPTNDSAAMKSCMKGHDLETEIMMGAAEFPLARDDLAFVTFNPRIDGDFFESDYEALMAEAPQMPTLIGFNTHEATVDTENYDNFTKTALEDFIKGPGAKLIGTHLSKSELNMLTNETIKFYVDGWANHSDYKHYLEQYTHLISDLGFIAPIVREARARSEKGSQIYAFQFDYVNSELASMLPFNASSHGGEIPYLFNVFLFGSFDMNEEDYKARQQLVGTFSSFVKNGDPSTKTFKWTPLKSNETTKLTILDTSVRLDKESKVVDRVNFWTNVTKDFQFDIVRGVKKSTVESKTRAKRTSFKTSIPTKLLARSKCCSNVSEYFLICSLT